MNTNAVAPGKERRPSEGALSAASSEGTPEEVAAAVRIQALYRAHSFRTDPANEELLDELHRRLEAIGDGLHDDADDLGGPNSPSRAKKPVLMSASTMDVIEKAEKEIEQHIKEGEEEKKIEDLSAEADKLKDDLATKEAVKKRERDIIKSQAYMRGALARKHVKEMKAKRDEEKPKTLDRKASFFSGAVKGLFKGVEVTPQQQAKMRKRINVLIYDLAQKDTYIERLVAEVNDRSEALRVAGVQLSKLRARHDVAKNARDDVAGRMQALVERTSGAAAANAPWRKSDDPSVYAAGLASELRKEQRMGVHFMAKLQALFDEAKRAQGTKQRLLALRQAHAQQTAEAKKLRAGAKSAKKYRAAIRNQERTIGRLEKVLKHTLDEPPPIPKPERRVEGTAEEQKRVDALTADIALKKASPDEWIKHKEAALQKELEQKTAKGGALGPAGPGSADEAAADRRVKMLEEQMVTNAREFSGQMSELKMKIMEMEMGMDDDDF